MFNTLPLKQKLKHTCPPVEEPSRMVQYELQKGNTYVTLIRICFQTWLESLLLNTGLRILVGYMPNHVFLHNYLHKTFLKPLCDNV